MIPKINLENILTFYLFLIIFSISFDTSAQWNEFKEINLHPNFYSIPFKIESRKLSFYDPKLFEKTEETIIRKQLIKSNMGNYFAERDNIFFSLMFLNNNWICYEGRLFKVENKIAKGILNNSRDSLSQARNYVFSDQFVIDEAGYVIDITKDKLCASASCGNLQMLKNKYDLKSYKIRSLPNNSINMLPYWASNPTYINLLKFSPIYNDSLVFLIAPIGGTPFKDLPLNKVLTQNLTFNSVDILYQNFIKTYRHEEKYGIDHFFKKYNLNSENNFAPKNIISPKNDACIILEFNYLKDKLNVIYDSGILPLFPKKLSLDRTGRLLIVSNMDFVPDRTDKINLKQHESIIIFDTKNKHELIEIPGRFIDITTDNRLIVNGNSENGVFKKNTTYEYSVPNFLMYDELNLNEILENIDCFEVPSIKKSMNIDEFTTTEEFINTLKELQKANITNSQSKFQNNVNAKGTAFIKPNTSYNTADFLNKVAEEDAKLCNCFSSKLNELPDSIEVPFTYDAYDLNKQTLTFKFKDVILNKLGEPYESLIYMLGCNGWIEVCPTENSKSIIWDASGRSDNGTFTMRNITPEMGRSLKNNCKLVVTINKKNELRIDELQRYSQNQILIECLGELYKKNPKEIDKLLGERITSDHISVFKIYLKIGNEQILIKSR